MDAKGLCLMPELELKDEELTKLLDSLKTSKTRKLNAVLEDVYSWLSSKPTFRLFLLVLRNMYVTLALIEECTENLAASKRH